MDESSLVSMMMQSGMVKSEAQAKQMAGQMKGMTDDQVKLMMKVPSCVWAHVAQVCTGLFPYLCISLLVYSLLCLFALQGEAFLLNLLRAFFFLCDSHSGEERKVPPSHFTHHSHVAHVPRILHACS